MQTSKTAFVVFLVTTVAAIASTVSYPTSAQGESQAPDAAGTGCGNLSAPVTMLVNPTSQSSFLTTSTAEVADQAERGFTNDQGVPFQVSLSDGADLMPVHRLYSSRSDDFLWTLQPAEILSAQARYGFVDQGIAFYASTTDDDCRLSVHRYIRRGKHRLVSTENDREQLVAQGWRYEGVSFYAAPPAPDKPPAADDGDSSFTVAVIPPTQQQVLRLGDNRFVNLTRWLTGQKTALDLRFVTHTGDVVNWGDADRSQFRVVSDGMKPLESAGIPYSLAVGNHDTAAVCTGGSACDPKRTKALFRDTGSFNEYFTAKRFGGVTGQFEPGKVDNSYSTFEAAGKKWMVLTMEMWPRTGAVEWANDVVASNPHHNVIVVTHDYLTASGQISTKKGYGATSGRYLFDNLIRKYANIKLVFSGHVGASADRVDNGVAGNKIHTIMFHRHDNVTNPVQLVRIDTRARVIKTRIYAPDTDQTYPEWNRTVAGVDWVS